MITRKEFIKSGLAVASLPVLAAKPKVLPKWKPGELDLHFIYTGVGENTFHIYPDGTTMLLDTGDFHWGEPERRLPWLPSGERLGGEWVARYLQRIAPRSTIDYLMVSHWHSDHIGEPTQRTRTLKDGRKVCGIPAVGEAFHFGTFYHHQPNNLGKHTGGGDKKAMEWLLDWANLATKQYGLKQAKFQVGALNQIKLLHDNNQRYSKNFRIRNLSANGVLWDGKDGQIDYASMTPHGVSQNSLSAAIRIDYGAFSFYTGGDTSYTFQNAKGERFGYEGEVGKACGRVSVAKANHHAYLDAMTQEFVDAVPAKVYVNNVWCPSQINDLTTPRMVKAGGRVYHTYLPDAFRQKMVGTDWANGVEPQCGHVVVRVASGGATFKVYVLDAHDENMHIISEREFQS